MEDERKRKALLVVFIDEIKVTGWSIKQVSLAERESEQRKTNLFMRTY
jgi:phenylpyruvate tautomerase PptA (4-oxalocrotonate tautomerase family)